MSNAGRSSCRAPQETGSDVRAWAAASRQSMRLQFYLTSQFGSDGVLPGFDPLRQSRLLSVAPTVHHQLLLNMSHTAIIQPRRLLNASHSHHVDAFTYHSQLHQIFIIQLIFLTFCKHRRSSAVHTYDSDSPQMCVRTQDFLPGNRMSTSPTNSTGTPSGNTSYSLSEASSPPSNVKCVNNENLSTIVSKMWQMNGCFTQRVRISESIRFLPLLWWPCLLWLQKGSPQLLLGDQHTLMTSHMHRYPTRLTLQWTGSGKKWHTPPSCRSSSESSVCLW